MSYNPFSLEGKTILVTGASSGIGRATAIECSKLGANLILTGRKELSLQETKEQLTIQNEEVSKMLPLQYYSSNVLNEVFQINCFSPMLLLKYLVKKKKLRNPSSVVFTASISGYNNIALANGIYGTSKSALSAYMKFAALELAGKGIRCNAVHPGRVNTPLISSSWLTKEDVIKDIEQYPLRRYGNPEEIAYAIIYLLSDASAWVTGTNLVIDGGRNLK